MVNEGFLVEPAAMHSRAKMSWQQVNLKKESDNAFKNYAMLNEAHEIGQAHCMSTMQQGNKPAIVIGSGGSLDTIIEELVDWPYPIFCSSSQISSLVMHKRNPEFLCVLDPTCAPSDELAVPPGELGKSQLLTHPSAPYEYLQRWIMRTSSKAFFFRILEPTYDWYTHHLRWAYPWIKAQVLPFIDSAASEISLATKLGYNPIYLLGVDYGGLRFEWWRWINEKWELDAEDAARRSKGVIVDAPKQLPISPGTMIGTGGLETSEMMEYCMRGVLITSFMGMKDKLKKLRLYHLTGKSNLNPFIPTLLWKDLKANDWKDKGEWTEEFRQKWTDMIEIWLAHKDTIMVPTEMGYPTTDWRVYMMNQDRAIDALMELNREIMVNKQNFGNIENQFHMPIKEMIKKELLTLEKGEILIRDEYEREDWDWRKMAPVDVEGMTNRLKWLSEQKSPGVERKPPTITAPEETPEERLDKAIRRKGHRGLGPDASGYGGKKKPGG